MSEKRPIAKDYSQEETKQRFEAALRGARIAGPLHVQSVTPKKAKSQSKTDAPRKKK
jgi:hypothetical protein